MGETDDLKLVERLRVHRPYNESPHGDGVLVREAADAIERLVRERGSDTGHDCDICRQRIFGAMIGNGDGSGQRFAHPDCYYRRRNNEAEAERDRLAELVAEMRQSLAYLLRKSAEESDEYSADHPITRARALLQRTQEQVG